MKVQFFVGGRVSVAIITDGDIMTPAAMGTDLTMVVSPGPTRRVGFTCRGILPIVQHLRRESEVRGRPLMGWTFDFEGEYVGVVTGKSPDEGTDQPIFDILAEIVSLVVHGATIQGMWEEIGEDGWAVLERAAR